MKDWTGRIIGVLVGGLLSLMVLLATLGATFPTRASVSEMIQKESPYVQDRSLILHRLEQIEKKLDQLLVLGKKG